MGRTRRTHSRSESRQQSSHPIRLVRYHILGRGRIDDAAVSAPVEPRPAKYIESFNPRLRPYCLPIHAAETSLGGGLGSAPHLTGTRWNHRAFVVLSSAWPAPEIVSAAPKL